MPGKEIPPYLRLVMPDSAPQERRSTGPRNVDTIYVIRITLSHTKPPIWRRVAVPADFTLDRLHEVIQQIGRAHV